MSGCGTSGEGPRRRTCARKRRCFGIGCRRRSLGRLGQGPASISQLAAPLEMTLTGLKKHVRILEDAHLVTTIKSGRVRKFRIDTAALRAAEAWINQRRTTWEQR